MDKVTLYNIIIIVMASVVAMTIEMMILPRVIFIAKKKKLFDLPDKRKKHEVPVPRLGGVSFTPVIILITMFTIFIRFRLDVWTEQMMFSRISEIILLVCGLLIIYLLGVKDDLVGVSFKKKFLIQFIASFFIVGSGIYIDNFYGLLGIYEVPAWFGIMISVGLIIFITNAINLIDGADGLASSVSAVALTMFGVLFCVCGMWTYACIAFITIGVLSPFFYYNFFHPTRKIFMGDTGSLTLGFLLAFMLLRLVKYPPICEVVPSGLLLLVLSGLFIPLFDALKVMFVRISLGKGPFTPDRNHIHHKLMDLGVSKKITVLIITVASVLIILLTWLLLYNDINTNIVLVIDLALGVICNVAIYRLISIKLRKESLDATEIITIEESSINR